MRAGRREKKRKGVRVHQSSAAQPVTYWYWSASQSISISLICSHIQLCLAPSSKQHVSAEASENCNTVMSSHIWSMHRKNTSCSGTYGCAQWRSEHGFMCTIHFSLCLKSLGWVCYSFCYNISIWREDECVPFFIRPPPRPVFLPPAESCCLGGKTWL